MSYDFRKHAGQRDLIDNYQSGMAKVEAAYKAGRLRASQQALRITADLLQNFGLTLVLKESYIGKSPVGSDSYMIDGALTILDPSDAMQADAVKGAVWDTTGIDCRTVSKLRGRWVCGFSEGG